MGYEQDFSPAAAWIMDRTACMLRLRLRLHAVRPCPERLGAGTLLWCATSLRSVAHVVDTVVIF